jgi:hypothetical protein
MRRLLGRSLWIALAYAGALLAVVAAGLLASSSGVWVPTVLGLLILAAVFITIWRMPS